MRHTNRIAALLTLAAATPAFATGVHAQSDDQSRPIDRWLVTSASGAFDRAVAPLISDADRRFPDRAVEVGPGTWSLVREDGAATIRLAGGATDGATLAHAYVRSGTEGHVELEVSADGCGEIRVWLNGQALGGGGTTWTVLLTDGWNTLLVGIPASCPPEVSATLHTARIPLPRDARPLEPGRLRVQASRPPGIRAALPAGSVTVGMPRPTHPVWRAGSDELYSRVEYVVTAWGRAANAASADTAAKTASGEDREAPPSVDLTGEWTITLYLPMGVEMVGANLEMEEDGRLEGELDGQRIDGSFRDGWVSGDRFGWTTRWSGVGRGVDVTFEGTVEGDRMSGTLEFDDGRQREPRPGFESRFGFEGHRGGNDEADVDPDSAAAPPPAGDEAPGRPRGPGFGPPTDLEALHAQIRRQLLPPRPPQPPAPERVSLELRFDGEKLVDAVDGLGPARPVTRTGTVPFEKVMEAALDDRGLRLRIAWGDATRQREARMPADGVLRAFHAPIVLETGAAGSAGGALEGTFRVPDLLNGFTLETLGGEWSVDGEALAGAALCSPCRGGGRLQIRVTGAEEARVRVTDPGYPDAEGAASPEEWLRALADGRRYRAMSAAGGS